MRSLARPNPAAAEHQYRIAIALAKHGLHLVACHPTRERSPLYSGWERYRTRPGEVARWWNPAPLPYGQAGYFGPYAGAAIGLPCGLNGLLVVDDDTARYGLPESFVTFAARHRDDLAGVPFVSTPNGGTHYYFKNPDGLGNGTGKLPTKIDVRGKGGYVFAPASVTEHGQYGDLHPERILSAPPVPQWLTDALRSGNDGSGAAPFVFISDGDLGHLREPLRHIDPDCSRYDWRQVIAAIHKESGGSVTGLTLAHEWSRNGRKYTECIPNDGRDGAALLDAYWPDCDDSRGKYSGARYLRYLAINAGWKPYAVEHEGQGIPFTLPNTRAR